MTEQSYALLRTWYDRYRANYDAVAMISPRAKGVVRVVRTWEKLVGVSERCAFQCAVAEALALSRELTTERFRKRAVDPKIGGSR